MLTRDSSVLFRNLSDTPSSQFCPRSRVTFLPGSYFLLRVWCHQMHTNTLPPLQYIVQPPRDASSRNPWRSCTTSAPLPRCEISLQDQGITPGFGYYQTGQEFRRPRAKPISSLGRRTHGGQKPRSPSRDDINQDPWRASTSGNRSISGRNNWTGIPLRSISA